MSETFRIVSVALLLLAAAINLVRRQWALNILALGLQYICVFLIILEVRSPLLAAIKLIVGLMVTLMLYMTLVSSGLIESLLVRRRLSSGEVFRGTIAPSAGADQYSAKSCSSAICLSTEQSTSADSQRGIDPVWLVSDGYYHRTSLPGDRLVDLSLRL